MRAILFPLLTSLALASAGCVLPVPHRRIHGNGIDARVVNASDQSPVANAEIQGDPEGRTLATSDETGRFSIAPVHGWHGAYLVGPISYSLFPHFDIPAPSPPFRVRATGFAGRNIGPGDPLDPPDDDGLPTIRLKPARSTCGSGPLPGQASR